MGDGHIERDYTYSNFSRYRASCGPRGLQSRRDNLRNIRYVGSVLSPLLTLDIQLSTPEESGLQS